MSEHVWVSEYTLDRIRRRHECDRWDIPRNLPLEEREMLMELRKLYPNYLI